MEKRAGKKERDARCESACSKKEGARVFHAGGIPLPHGGPPPVHPDIFTTDHGKVQAIPALKIRKNSVVIIPVFQNGSGPGDGGSVGIILIVSR